MVAIAPVQRLPVRTSSPLAGHPLSPGAKPFRGLVDGKPVAYLHEYNAVHQHHGPYGVRAGLHSHTTHFATVRILFSIFPNTHTKRYICLPRYSTHTAPLHCWQRLQ